MRMERVSVIFCARLYICSHTSCPIANWQLGLKMARIQRWWIAARNARRGRYPRAHRLRKTLNNKFVIFVLARFWWLSEPSGPTSVHHAADGLLKRDPRTLLIA